MDAGTFDRLSRALVTAGSRRRLLGLLGGVLLADFQCGGDVSEAHPGRTRHRHHAQHHHLDALIQVTGNTIMNSQ